MLKSLNIRRNYQGNSLSDLLNESNNIEKLKNNFIAFINDFNHKNNEDKFKLFAWLSTSLFAIDKIKNYEFHEKLFNKKYIQNYNKYFKDIKKMDLEKYNSIF